MIHDTFFQDKKKERVNTDTAIYIMTRFNVYWPDFYEGEEEFQAWSDRRFAVFLNTCVQPIKNQNIAADKWFVAFDETWKNRESQLIDAVDSEIFQPIFIPRSVGISGFVKYIPETIRSAFPEHEYVAGIRLDSDDSLSKWFIHFLDDCITVARSHREVPFVVNFPYQLKTIDRRVGVYCATDSPTSVVFERRETANGPFLGPHHKYWEAHQVLECGTRFPMVLAHGHDDNIGKFPWHSLTFIENARDVVMTHFGIDIKNLSARRRRRVWYKKLFG